MPKERIIKYLEKNKELLSIRAIAANSGFQNLPKVIRGERDMHGNLFTFPDRHVYPVLKQIQRLQSVIKS